ncbi:hypothetical protein O1611_g10388 [Lasiodiplodia mahajangana]|uniref:Uncharacterized protein n=1 Tax=Lasiodiplodia mahajangana TaxID=1108764 RepID=A0ACC2IYR5_9PEZI|nr:hypothetical protein O1611_g10388 [Lasiodiplodia mahajangana]
MVGLGAVPAVLQCVLLFFMPETPRWLVKVKRSDAARVVIQKTSGSGPAAAQMVDAILKDIEIEVREEEDNASLGSGDGKSRRSWLNSLMYFSATIFLMLGFTVPTLTSLTVASTNFIFTVAALLLIDRIGRRRILLYSIPFMGVGLLATALGFNALDMPSVITRDSFVSQGAPIFILVNIMVYVAAYALGLGNVPWMQSELFPLNVRSLGSGLATATNWLANFIVGLTFLPLMDALTPSWTFVLYSVVCVAGWIAVWFIYPETVGLSLEEATSLLEHGWGVR